MARWKRIASRKMHTCALYPKTKAIVLQEENIDEHSRIQREIKAVSRSEWLEFQSEDLSSARKFTSDAERLYALGPAGDAVLCWLDSQSKAAKLRQLSVPVIDFYSGDAEKIDGWDDLKKKARQGLLETAMRDAVPVKLVFYSSVFPNSPPVLMAGLLRITAMLDGPAYGRKNEWYAFDGNDVAYARELTADADRLYAAGKTGDYALNCLALQHDAKQFGKSSPLGTVEIRSQKWRAEMADEAYIRMSRQGLADGEAVNSLAVEIAFYSGAMPSLAPVRMAGIVYVGAMIEGKT